MKGVVLSGGTGSRLRPITFSMAKQLVPIANKPILFYGLEDLAEAGVHDVAIIISPETGDEVREAVGDGRALGLENVEYIVQDAPLGLAHALACALPWADGDDVLMYLGDNVVKKGVVDVVREFENHQANASILLTKVPNPSAFGVAELDNGGNVVRLVEKPKQPKSDLALVGVYLFDRSIADAIDSISPSARGELEITDAIQFLIDSGKVVKPSTVSGWWKDTGRKEDLLHANELILEGLTGELDGQLIDTRIRGEVSVGDRSQVVDCSITGPVIIGADVHLSRTTIGPNTAIGNDCRVSDAEIEESIVMEGTSIEGFRMRRSLIGRSSVLRTRPGGGWTEVTLGERSELVEE